MRARQKLSYRLDPQIATASQPGTGRETNAFTGQRQEEKEALKNGIIMHPIWFSSAVDAVKLFPWGSIG